MSLITRLALRKLAAENEVAPDEYINNRDRARYSGRVSNLDEVGRNRAVNNVFSVENTPGELMNKFTGDLDARRAAQARHYARRFATPGTDYYNDLVDYFVASGRRNQFHELEQDHTGKFKMRVNPVPKHERLPEPALPVLKNPDHRYLETTQPTDRALRSMGNMMAYNQHKKGPTYG